MLAHKAENEDQMTSCMQWFATAIKWKLLETSENETVKCSEKAQ